MNEKNHSSIFAVGHCDLLFLAHFFKHLNWTEENWRGSFLHHEKHTHNFSFFFVPSVSFGWLHNWCAPLCPTYEAYCNFFFKILWKLCLKTWMANKDMFQSSRTPSQINWFLRFWETLPAGFWRGPPSHFLLKQNNFVLSHRVAFSQVGYGWNPVFQCLKTM